MKQLDDLTISNGNIFLVSDKSGDIGTNDFQGLYSADVRHLSTYMLLINNMPLEVLTSKTTGFDSATMVLTNTHLEELPGFDLSIVRKRTITKIYHEEISITNNSTKQRQFTLTLQFATDFADIFAIRSLTHDRNKQFFENRIVTSKIRKKDSQLVFSYRRETFRRSTVIQVNAAVKFEKDTCSLTVTLDPKQTFSFSLSIAFLFGRNTITGRKINKIKAQSEILHTWQWSGFQIETDWDDFEAAFKKSLKDLAALRIHEEEAAGRKLTSIPAAGIPWFVAVFGRDSLITAYQTIILGTDLAIGTLQLLAKYQGKEMNDARNEQPGKILHEIRFGEAAFFRDWVPFPYYGTVDATPLFLILLSEVYRFGAPERFINKMKGPALAALNWIDKYGDLDQDGFIEYHKTSERGLDNQNWRDSWDSMIFSDGTIAKSPIASSDVQGYAYDAKMRMAEIARNVWKEKQLADTLEKEARELKKRFNEAFWVKDKGYFALGLDKDKRQIDSLASCIGQLLWSGIVEEDKIKPTVDLLFSESLYSGWGVRTISKQDEGYNPIIYHRGTVWPHDNSLIAAGLAKVGERDKALRIIQDMITASACFDYRLPEVFAGFSRNEMPFPVQYPTACSPQAWAAATPILFLRLLLGLEPNRKRQTLTINPIIPEGMENMHIDGIAAFGKQFSVEFRPKRSFIYQSA